MLGGGAVTLTPLNGHITNCISEIPQNIKVEINSNGNLVLKAGSIVYFPNGKDSNGELVFEKYIVPQDIINTHHYNDRRMAYVEISNGTVMFGSQRMNLNTGEEYNNIDSGATQPSFIQYGVWYNTSTNYIKETSNGSTTFVGYISLPVCTFISDNEKVTEIDTIFNGFGYIGQHTFTIPGLKYLIPDGRNEDGSYKNIEAKIEKVQINGLEDQVSICCMLMSDGKCHGWGAPYHIYYRETTLPEYQGIFSLCYIERENLWYMATPTDSWKKVYEIICGKMVKTAADKNISGMKPLNPFRLLSTNNSMWIARQSLPTTMNYNNLTMLASEAKYIAPTDGYFYVYQKATTNDASYTSIESNGYQFGIDMARIDAVYKGLIPVQKGDEITIRYNNCDTKAFRFIFMVGNTILDN